MSCINYSFELSPTQHRYAKDIDGVFSLNPVKGVARGGGPRVPMTPFL